MPENFGRELPFEVEETVNLGTINPFKEFTPEEIKSLFRPYNSSYLDGLTSKEMEERMEHSCLSKEGIKNSKLAIANRSEEEKEEQYKRVSYGVTLAWASGSTRLSSKERGQRISRAIKQYYLELPPEEKKERDRLAELNSKKGAQKVRELLSDPETKRQWMKRPLLSPEARISWSGYLQLQSSFYLLLEEYFPGEWIHNGGQPNSTWIAGLEPDFIHKGKKIIIEFFEAWAHTDLEEESRKRERYGELGYELLIVREEDLWVDGVVSIIDKIKFSLEVFRSA